jgi:hypothetical protein
MSVIEDAIAKASEVRQAREERIKEPVPVPSAVWELPQLDKRWSYCAGIFLLLSVAGLGVYRFSARSAATPALQQLAAGPGITSHPAAQLAAAEPAQKYRLPNSVPLDALDPAYSEAHPGWQRYKGQTLEFRVFRQGGAVRAIQVIAPQGKVIPEQFFGSFLGEIAGKEPLTVQTSESKSGSFIERGTLGSVAEIVMYRQKPAGAMRALVVAYR